MQIGERYHFTIFHVEREGCGSELHIDATNFDFILSELEEPPRDYIVYVDEDFYVDGIIETIFLADTFSAGPPFEVNILSGGFIQRVYYTLWFIHYQSRIHCFSMLQKPTTAVCSRPS